MLSLMRRPQTAIDPLEAWTANAGAALQRAFDAQELYTLLDEGRIGPRAVTFVFIPRPPTPKNFKALLSQDKTVRAMLRVDKAMLYEERGAVCVRVPHPWAAEYELDPFAFVGGAGLCVPAGITDNGETDEVDFDRSPHVGIFGPTGGGKSTLARMLALHLAQQNDPRALRMFVVAADRADWDAFDWLPHSWGFVHHTEAERALTWLQEHARERETTGVKTPRIVAFVDDLADLLNRSPSLGPVLGAMTSQARHGGVHLVLISQRKSKAGTGDALVSANLRRVFVTGVTSAADATLYTGHKESGAEELGDFGEVASISNGRVKIITVPNVTNEHLYQLRGDMCPDEPGWLKTARKTRTYTPVSAISAPISASEDTSNAIPGTESAPAVSPSPLIGLTEREQGIVRMVREFKSAHEIAVTLTGQRGGPTYQTCVKEVKELITRFLPQD